MLKNQFIGGIPLCFKIVELSQRYELLCKNCSYDDKFKKQTIRKAVFDGEWHNEMSDRLWKHDEWHEQHPNENWDEFHKQKLAEASRQAMEHLNRAFGNMMFS